MNEQIKPLNELELQDLWKRLIFHKTLSKGYMSDSKKPVRAYLNFFKGRCQVIIKIDKEYFNFNITDAPEKVLEYQREHNLIE